MQVTISITIQELAKLLIKVQSYTKSENLKEKIDLDRDKQSLVRELLEDDNYFSIENMMSLTNREHTTVRKALSHIMKVEVDSVAFVNEFDSTGVAYAMVHIAATLNIK